MFGLLHSSSFLHFHLGEVLSAAALTLGVLYFTVVPFARRLFGAKKAEATVGNRR